MVTNTQTEKQLLIEKAIKSINPFEKLLDNMQFNNAELQVRFHCKRKGDMSSKTLKWAFKLAEKNVGPYYKTCSLGWQPKIKQTDLNKNWARYLIATDEKNVPIAYSMFRFDLDYERCVLYCYEMQVEESAQRKGLGAYMMSSLESVAKFWNMERVVLTVLKNNEDAMRFYVRLGYSIDETSPDKSENAAYEILSKMI